MTNLTAEILGYIAQYIFLDANDANLKDTMEKFANAKPENKATLEVQAESLVASMRENKKTRLLKSDLDGISKAIRAIPHYTSNADILAGFNGFLPTPP